MTSLIISRRNFIKTSASAAACLSIPRLGFGQTTTGIRLEWQQFKTTPQYTSFLNAVRTMKANTNSSSPSSWEYWTNVHVNYCPHSSPYFLAWHRGYLYFFEQQLRIVSGDNALCVPYWNYYKYPQIPAEFTDPATNNPLYMPRTGTNVYNALTLSPFASTVWNFQRGTSNAFEPQIEAGPHNPVHNLIGGEMANMTSPRDPIFYLHHANMDRLCHAWALPDGKGIPYTHNPYNASTDSPYWAGSFTYSSTMTMARYKTYYPGWLNFDYADNNKPTSLPPSAQANPHNPIKLVQAQMGQMLNRPMQGKFATTPGRAIAANRRSAGGVLNVDVDENSVSAQLPVQAADTQLLQTIAAAGVSGGQATAGSYKSVKVVLDNIKITGAGKKGGFFYNIYLNLPQSGDVTASRQRYFLGTLGAFELAGAAHHGSATLEYPATEAITNMAPADLGEVTVSLVRVSGENAPRGNVLHVGEIRVELSTDDPFDRSSSVPASADNCYCQR
jgi:tyrosinase